VHEWLINKGFFEVAIIQKPNFGKFINQCRSLPVSFTSLPEFIIDRTLSLSLLRITLLHLLITVLISTWSLLFLQSTLLLVKSTLSGIRITLPDLRGCGRSFPTFRREVKAFGREDKAHFDFMINFQVE
jgi:hypothetical protein